MFKEALNRHVNVFLNDGTVLDGLLAQCADDYSKIMELDNNIVIFKTTNIEVLRIINTPLKKEVKEEIPKSFVFKPVRHVDKPSPLQEELEINDNNDAFFYAPTEDDFSMTLQKDEFTANMSVNPIKGPEFVRQTPRCEDDFNFSDED